MGLFVNQQNKRSELQERIAADLREKAKLSSQQGEPKEADIEDMKYLEGTKQTTGLAWAWALIFFMAVAVIVMFLM